LLSKHQQLGLEEGHKSNHDFEKPRNWFSGYLFYLFCERIGGKNIELI
jgi:hypothetical protein